MLNNEVIEYLAGSCKTLDEAISAFSLSLSEADLEKLMLENGHQFCSTCCWWNEVQDMVHIEEEGEDVCESCVEEHYPDLERD